MKQPVSNIDLNTELMGSLYDIFVLTLKRYHTAENTTTITEPKIAALILLILLGCIKNQSELVKNIPATMLK